MTVRTNLLAGDSAPLPDTSAIPAFIVAAPQATTGAVYQINPGDAVDSSLGFSDGEEDVFWFLRTAKQACVVGVAATTQGSLSSVTHVGTGPTVTAALTGSLAGPLMATTGKFKIMTAGANGTAVVGYYLDGSGDYSQYTTQVPTEGSAVIDGATDITYGADLNGLTLVFTAPAAKTLTFPVGPFAASASGALHGATATVAAPVTLSSFLAPAVALLDGANGSRLVFTTAGVTASDAPATVTISGIAPDGVTAISEVLALAQTATTATSVLRYRGTGLSLAYPAADGTGATIAIGYTDTYPLASDIIAEINTLAVAAPLAVLSRVSQTATASLVELYSTGTGAGVTETLDLATSTADTPLGITTLTATGSAATLVLPYVGYTLTFASGSYVLDETYAVTTTGPTASVSAIATAADAIRNSGYAFGYLLPLVVPTSATNARSLCDTLDTKIGAWNSDANAPIFEAQITPGPFHTASANPTTNNTAITANDQAVDAAFNSGTRQTSNGTVVPDDGYRRGTKIVGSYRRPAALGLSYMLSRFKLSDDPGAATHGPIPEYSLTAPDGVTLARNEADPRIVVHMGGNSGPGFTTLQLVNKLPRVTHGTTRAGQTSRLVDLGPGLRMGLRGQQVLYNTAKTGIENETFPTDAAGILLEGTRNALVGLFTSDLSDALLTPPLNNNASSVSVSIVATEIIANTNNITVTATLQKLGVAENVTITALVSGVVQGTTLAG